MFLQKSQNVSKPKKIQATNCSSGHVEGSFDKLFNFLAKVWKYFAQNSKNFWKEKQKNYLFRNLYSGHLDKFLRTIPKVSAENPKWFKTFKKDLKSQNVPLDAQKVVLTISWSFLAESPKKFSLKIRKNSEKKNKKTVSSAIFTLDTYIEFWEPCRRFLQKVQNDSIFRKKHFKPQTSHLDT